MAAIATDAEPEKKYKFKYLIEYVDKDGQVINFTGFSYLSTVLLVYKFIAVKHRKDSITGFFRRCDVIALDDDGKEIGDPHSQNVVEQMSAYSKEAVAKGKKAVSGEKKPDFDKKACFMYRYVGQLKTDDMKKHKFYETVPHV